VSMPPGLDAKEVIVREAHDVLPVTSFRASSGASRLSPSSHFPVSWESTSIVLAPFGLSSALLMGLASSFGMAATIRCLKSARPGAEVVLAHDLHGLVAGQVLDEP